MLVLFRIYLFILSCNQKPYILLYTKIKWKTLYAIDILFYLNETTVNCIAN